MEKIIKTIKEDIGSIITELKNMRKQEMYKWLQYSCASDMDFRDYRKMVDTLMKSYDSLKRMYECDIDAEFISWFSGVMTCESEEIHTIMGICMSSYNQYRCLSDAYCKMIDKMQQIKKNVIEFTNKSVVPDVSYTPCTTINTTTTKVVLGNILDNVDGSSYGFKIIGDDIKHTYSIQITEDSVETANLLSEKFPEIFEVFKGFYIGTGEPVKSIHITI